ncbi:MAG: HAD family hydrolase, partial [Planctomycetes bacterium]|nr:HAD family hydrolase [Planctomycetota bacterium]
MTIRAVCFDLDDTLLDHSAAERSAALVFQGVFRDQLPPCADFPLRWKTATAAAFDRYLAGEIPFQGQRRARIRALFADDAISDAECDARFATYLEGCRRDWRLFPDTLPALDALRGVPLAVVSNAPLAQQRDKLARFGL